MATYNQGLPPPPIQCQIYPALESLRPETCRHCGFCLPGRTYCILLLFIVSRSWQDSRLVKLKSSSHRGKYGRHSLSFQFHVTFFPHRECTMGVQPHREWAMGVQTPHRECQWECKLSTGIAQWECKLCIGNVQRECILRTGNAQWECKLHTANSAKGMCNGSANSAQGMRNGSANSAQGICNGSANSAQGMRNGSANSAQWMRNVSANSAQGMRNGSAYSAQGMRNGSAANSVQGARLRTGSATPHWAWGTWLNSAADTLIRLAKTKTEKCTDAVLKAQIIVTRKFQSVATWPENRPPGNSINDWGRLTWAHRPIAGKSGIRPSGQVLNTILKDLTVVMNIMLSHVGRCT